MMALSQPHPSARYDTVAQHFAACSSGRNKLALWETLVRYANASHILEIGTAYGLSAIAMALAQTRPHMTTIDFLEPQASLGPANVKRVLPEGIEFITKDKSKALPELAAAGRTYDFVLHDGGHTGDSYVKDFQTILPMLEPGSMYIIDDIDWDRSQKIRNYTQESVRTCYEGWTEVVSDENVEGAVVYGSIGILLLQLRDRIVH